MMVKEALEEIRQGRLISEEEIMKKYGGKKIASRFRPHLLGRFEKKPFIPCAIHSC
jgi:translation elongation factor EF-G